MSIYSDIKDNVKKARLAKDATIVSILSTLLGELDLKAEMVDGAKVVSDETAVSVLKKNLKGVEEILAINPKATQPLMERVVINSYLPQQLTNEEIEVTLSGRKASGELTSFKDAMVWLKTELPGLYDGKAASQIAKGIFG